MVCVDICTHAGLYADIDTSPLYEINTYLCSFIDFGLCSDLDTGLFS